MIRVTVPRPRRHDSTAPLLYLAIAMLGLACLWAAALFGQPATTTYYYPNRPPQLAAELWDQYGVTPGALTVTCSYLAPDSEQKGAVRVTASGALEVSEGSTWRPLAMPQDGFVVRSYYRWGPGWPCAGRCDFHAAGEGYYEDLSRAMPERWPPLSDVHTRQRYSRERALHDISYDCGLFRAVRDAKEKLDRGEDPGAPPLYSPPGGGGGGGGPVPTPVPTATPVATPVATPSPTPAGPCRPGCQNFGGVCNCPGEQPAPVPSPTATPQPTATPVPCATCPPALPVCKPLSPRAQSWLQGAADSTKTIKLVQTAGARRVLGELAQRRGCVVAP